MHITKTLTALAIAASVLAAAPSADAARNSLGVTGSGTWTPAATGISAQGTSKGTPVAGQTLTTIAPTDGSLPTQGVCEPVTGTVEITSKTAALELDIAATACRLYAPGGFLAIIGNYHVVRHHTRKGDKPAAGSGRFEADLLADTSTSWAATGTLR